MIDLVYEFIIRPEVDGVLRSRRVPILVFTGVRGSGKTALLGELAQRLDQQAPLALIDCERIDTTTTEKVLLALAFELTRRRGKYRSLPFHRFFTGQLAIAQELDTKNRRLACEKVEEALKEYRKIDRLRKFISEIAPMAIPYIPGAERIPGVNAIGRYIPDLVIRGLMSRRWGVRVVLGVGTEWYRHQDRGLDRDPIDELVDLNRMAHSPDIASQREAGELLWSAFLADLRSAFQDEPRADEWTLDCVVLIDNADCLDVPNFLDELNRARNLYAAAHDSHGADPLAVLVTSRGILSQRITPANESVPIAENASYDHYDQRGNGQLQRDWYPVLLRDLKEEEVGNMVAALGLRQGTDARITTMVHTFTGGHPGSTRLVLDAIREHPAHGLDLRTILANPEPLERGLVRAPEKKKNVEERLLQQFLQDVPEHTVHDLVTCAAARNSDEASQLCDHSGLMIAPKGLRTALFTAEVWTATPEGTAMLPVLRVLLLRRLAARPPSGLPSTEKVRPPSWTEVHSWLQGHCAKNQDEAGELHHTLALGDVKSIAERLAELLTVTEVTHWLHLVDSVTAAPNQMGHQHAKLDQVMELTDWTHPGDLPLAPLARLIAARWLADDRLCNSSRKSLLREIAASYHDIAPYSGKGSGKLRDKAAEYHNKARPWD